MTINLQSLRVMTCKIITRIHSWLQSPKQHNNNTIHVIETRWIHVDITSIFIGDEVDVRYIGNIVIDRIISCNDGVDRISDLSSVNDLLYSRWMIIQYHWTIIIQITHHSLIVLFNNTFNRDDLRDSCHDLKILIHLNAGSGFSGRYSIWRIGLSISLLWG